MSHLVGCQVNAVMFDVSRIALALIDTIRATGFNMKGNPKVFALVLGISTINLIDAMAFFAITYQYFLKVSFVYAATTMEVSWVISLLNEIVQPLVYFERYDAVFGNISMISKVLKVMWIMPIAARLAGVIQFFGMMSAQMPLAAYLGWPNWLGDFVLPTEALTANAAFVALKVVVVIIGDFAMLYKMYSLSISNQTKVSFFSHIGFTRLARMFSFVAVAIVAAIFPVLATNDPTLVFDLSVIQLFASGFSYSIILDFHDIDLTAFSGSSMTSPSTTSLKKSGTAK